MNFRLFNTGFPRINLALVIIILMVALHAIISFVIIRKNNQEVTHMINVMHPYIKSLDEFNLLVTETKMYTTNWVYLQVEEGDKDILKNIHQSRYPLLRARLIDQVRALNKPSEEKSLKEIFRQYEKLIATGQIIMIKLVSFEDYENPTRKFQAEDLVETEIIPMAEALRTDLSALIEMSRNNAELIKNEVIASSNSLRNSVVGVSLALLAAIVLGSFFISGSIRKPVLQMKSIVKKLAKGEPSGEKLNVSKDVIGQMTESMNTLSENFEKTSAFAGEIGKGNFNADFSLLSEQDKLGKALMGMRESLKAYSEDMEQQVETRTRELVEKSLKLEIAYGEIRDSISYAKHIQEAILPSQDLIFEVFKQSFIYYKPKDIVSGDFYWFAQRGDQVIVAVVDCTGHGVPGALMTVIGSSLMNQIVNIMGITSPAEILQNLDARVIETLKQHGETSSNDGMDIALFRYDLKKKELSYAGAKRSLFLFRKNEHREFKGDKFPIGSTQYGLAKSFKEHVTSIQPGDVIYMFSDGYQDQFGGMAGKKFMLKRFKEMLVEIHQMKMNDQLLVLESENTKWTGNSEQTDDILVLGIRF